VPLPELRRVGALPPYVFAAINDLKLDLRRAGEDVVDLGFGNPDLPSPAVAVEKLREAAASPRNHRYSSSRGIPNLRRAICDLYTRRFGVELDPETQALTTIGAKEGLAHLMWVLVQPGDAAVVPSPSYPIHLFAPAFAGAVVERIAMGRDEEDLLGNVVEAFERSRPRARVLLLSFPHNPTTAVVDAGFMQRVVDFAREQELLVIHDFAYADIAFDGHVPPSILQADGATEVAVELYTLTKSFSMAGWRVGFVVGNAEVVGALARLKSYLDYGTFQPIQIAAIVAMNEAPDFPREVAVELYTLTKGYSMAGWRVGFAVGNAEIVAALGRLKSYLDYGTFQPIQIAATVAMVQAAEYPAEVCELYRSRRNTLCDGLTRIGWEVAKPLGTMFVWAPIPASYRRHGSHEFALKLLREAKVSVSPGAGFGPGGDDHIRFALVENEQRIAQAVRGIRSALPLLGGTGGGVPAAPGR
jgi:alanine-synthesizing transaminase